ncbi:MAG: RHS repeat-associated core domain-containing protein [Candidatus Solibacter sp.]
MFCLDGQRLVPFGTTPDQLQPELDPSILVRMNGPAGAPVSFDVFHPTGQIWRYGSREGCSASSKSQVKGKPVVVSAPTDSHGLFTSDDFTETAGATERVIAWNLDRVEDRWGNFYNVDYLRQQDADWVVEVAPASITWTGFGGSVCSTQPSIRPSRRIDFHYATDAAGAFLSRQDPRIAYRAGLEIRQTLLLDKVLVSGPDALVSTSASSRTVRPFREYRMAYKPVPAGRRVIDRLESITECVYNTVQLAQCMEPISFSWTADNPLVPEFLPSKNPAQALIDDPSLDRDLRFDSVTGVDDMTASLLDSVVADFDGDGRDDYLYRLLWFVTPSNLINVPGTGIGQWYLRLGTPTGLGPRHAVVGFPNTQGGDPRFSPRAIDIDGDRMAEVLIYSEDALIEQTFRGDPSLNQYHVTDKIGYELFTLAPHACLAAPRFDCEFQARNLGETNILHPLNLVPRTSIAVQIGDLDGDGRPDLVRDDTDCPFSLSCSVGSPFSAHDISAGFRKGMGGTPPTLAPPVKVRRAFPAVGPFTDVTLRQFEGRYLVDIDGNGQPELITSTYDFVPTETPRAEMTGQYPFSMSALFFAPSGQTRNFPMPLTARPLSMSQMMQRLRGPCATHLPRQDFSRIFLDVNGDGLDDSIVFSATGKDPCSPAVDTTFLSLNAGGTFRAAQKLPFLSIGAGPRLNQLFTPARGYDSGARIADLNRDGRSDIIYFNEAGVFWLKSTGSGFQSYQLPIAGSNGTQAVPGTTIQYRRSDGLPSGYGPRLSRLGDFNGDGILDLVTVREKHVPAGPGFSYFEVNLGAPGSPDLISGVSGGRLRPKLEVRYGFGSVALPGGLYRVSASHSWPQIVLSKLGWVVKDYSIEADGLDTLSPSFNVYRYSYETARSDVTGRGFLGVDRRTRLLTDDAQVPTVFETETLDFELGTFRRVCRSGLMCTYPLLGIPVVRLTVVAIDGSKYRVNAQSTSRTVQARPSAAAGYDLSDSSAIEDSCEMSAPPVSTAAPCASPDEFLSSVRGTRQFDRFGNTVRSVREISNGSSLMMPPPSPVFRDELRALPARLLPYDESRWLTSRYQTWEHTSFDPTLPPAEQTIQQRITRVYEPNSVEVSRLTREAPASAATETAGTSGFTRTTIFARSNWGAVTTIEDYASGTARSTRIGFASGDPDVIFPSTFTNPRGHITTVWPHATLGVAFAIDNDNGVRTEWDYDAIGRTTKMRRPGGGEETYLYKNDSRPDGSLTRTWTFAQRGPAIADHTETYNALGLQIATQNEEFSDGAARSFTFDRFGEVVRVGYPVDASLTRTSKLFLEFERDGLGRVIKATRPGDTGPAAPFISRFGYKGRESSHISERNVISKIVRDAKGRVILSETLDQGRPVRTEMEYWHFDLLRQVRHPILPAPQRMKPPPARQPETLLSYDVYGRRISMDDPDTGFESYRYNGYDELKQVEDGNGAVTTFDRDDLGRVKRIQTRANAAYPGRPAQGKWAQDTQLTWDSAAFGLGKLARVVSVEGVAKTFEYDMMSRLRSVKTTDETGQEWPVSYEYNSNGLILAINYPATGNKPFRVEHEYGLNGSIESIFDASAPTRSLLWRKVAENLAGQSTLEEFGAAISIERQYDGAFHLRSQSGRWLSNKQAFQRITYDWGADGLLAKKADLDLPVTELYEHDALQRLKTWDVWQTRDHTKWQYDYDDWGNVRERRVVSGAPFEPTAYDYSTAKDQTHPHAVKRSTTGAVNPSEFSYLTGGQLSKGGDNVYTWTPFGLPASIANARATSSFLYDGLGRRTVRKDASPVSSRQVSIDGLFEFTSTSGSTSALYTYNVVRDGETIAQIRRTAQPSSESIRFFHNDRLGNPDAVTSVTRNTQGQLVAQLLERGKYEPFGERRLPSALAQPTAQNHGSPVDLGFTGHQPDDLFGLVDMGGRLYQPRTSQFISPDPIASVTPQTLNRYSYVRNSPVMRLDPTGYLDAPEPAPFDFTGDDWLRTSLAGASAESQTQYGNSGPVATVTATWTPDSDEGSASVASDNSLPVGGSAPIVGPAPGGSGGALDWYKNQMQPFAMANEGAWERLKGLILPSRPDMGTLGPPESRSKSLFPSGTPLGQQLNHLPLPPGLSQLAAALSGDPRQKGAADLDVFLFVIGPAVEEIAGPPTKRNVPPYELQRTHSISGKASSRKVSDLAKSMSEVGWQGESIVVIEYEGKLYVIDGHHRLSGAKRAGLEVVPVEVVPFTPRPGSWQTLEELLNDALMVGPDKIRRK